MKLLNWYSKKINKRPILTKCLTSFITFAIGDLLCQRLENNNSIIKEHSYNWNRVFKQASFGFLFTPYIHFQFNIIIPKYIARGNFQIWKIVLYNQIVNSTIFSFSFFTYINILNGMSIDSALQDTLLKLPSTLSTAWKVWPFIQYINFTYIPIAYRVIFNNSFGVIWNIYLSYVQNVKKNI